MEVSERTKVNDVVAVTSIALSEVNAASGHRSYTATSETTPLRGMPSSGSREKSPAPPFTSLSFRRTGSMRSFSGSAATGSRYAS